MIQFFIFFIIFSNNIYSHKQISDSVEQLIDNQSNEIKTFLIHFRNVYKKQSKGKKHRITESKSDILIRHIQQVKAAQSQFEIDYLLHIEEYKIKSLWVSNSIRITCPVDFIESIYKRNDIRYIQLDSPIYLPALVSKKNLKSKEIQKISEGLKLLRVPKLRNSQLIDFKESHLKIGLIDTAFDKNSFNLKQITSKDFTQNDNSQETFIDHATYSLGLLIGAKNPKAKTAIVPNAHIYHAKVFHNNNTSTISVVLFALQWLLDPDLNPNTNDFPKVISNSWASLNPDKNLMLPFWEALSTMKKLGVIPVFPAGNSGESQKISLSSGLPHAMSIGSISREGIPSSFSTKAQVEWEGVIYNKPELFAPGENILSIFPNQQYGEITSTTCSSNYVAAIIAIIQEANPKLPPKEIKKILLQTTQRLSDGKKSYIVDAYQAIDLAKNGGLVKGLIDGPEWATQILVQPGDITFNSKTTGAFHFFLKEGNYQLSFTAKGFRPHKQSIIVVKQRKQSLMIGLQESQKHQFSIKVIDTKNIPVNGILNIQNNKNKLYNIENGNIEMNLYEGLYKGTIEVQGLKRKSFLLNVDRLKKHFDYQVSQAPPISIIKDSKENDKVSLLEKSLKALSLSYQVYNHTISKDQLLSHDIVFWMTEAESFDTLSDKEQDLIKEYISSGGRIVFSGENFAYHLQNTSFLNNICGVKFKQDFGDSSLSFKQQKIKLSSLTNNTEWYYPDSLSKFNDKASIFLFYQNKEIAAIFNENEFGASLFFGFSLNQISQEESRTQLIKQILNQIKPSLSQQIKRVQALFQLNKSAYHKLIYRLNQSTLNTPQEIKKQLRNFKNKKAFQPILKQLFYQEQNALIQQDLY